jgi:hypothetical protein
MKTTVPPHRVALLFLGLMAPVPAQNMISPLRTFEASHKSNNHDDGSESRFGDVSRLLVKYDVPAAKKAQADLSDPKPVYAAQDALTLETQATSLRSLDSVVDLNVLRSPSPYRKIRVSTSGAPYHISANSLQEGLALISAVYREAGKPENAFDCQTISLSVEQRIKLDPANVLELVEAEIGANPGCACEIVKIAIKASDADIQLVVSIAETAITSSPDSMRMVAQCAIAAMPESLTEVQALLAKLDPNSGDESVSAKSSKGAKSYVAAMYSPPLSNPLDLPPFPQSNPPIIVPPPVTDVNF